ncbi:ogr/Delta-like zinc finger family protein [Pseudomonas aeruginosa]|uniref:ogr/Delta-like zinc finger family protein n=1 Tax=Pseudomonas aeruginosa TaxID=287 RepID=UPI000FEFC9A6|nr:ogr/Delta-like zinc finger family protein [Pseudomonas aeruginosa]RPY83700.1 transcriptional regulator [Pseudomonas aeruginosa]
MRIYCPECDSKARIATREEISRQFVKLYCQCTNGHCGQRFVMQLTFSHALLGPSSPLDKLLFDRLREMPSQERRVLFDQLENMGVMDRNT